MTTALLLGPSPFPLLPDLVTTGTSTIDRPRPRAGLCISPQIGVGVPCTSWVTRISRLTILSVHFLTCRTKEGGSSHGLGRICCTMPPCSCGLCIDPPPRATTTLLQAGQASPLGAAPRGYLESPFCFQGVCCLSPPQVTLETPHREYRQAASLSCWLSAGPAVLLKQDGLPRPSWHTQWPIPGQRE